MISGIGTRILRLGIRPPRPAWTLYVPPTNPNTIRQHETQLTRTTTVNWYRTRKINYDDELALSSGTIKVPVLFIQALKDEALPPHLGKGMAKHLPQLQIKHVDASHWALWERPKEVNEILDVWVDEVVAGGRSAKL
jgi:pimeloyl-ACP methyl ester carboxylesterase